MSDINKQTGKRVKQLREDLGFSQKELAAIIGVAPSTISGIETGAQGISKIAPELARALHTTLDHLYFLTDDALRTDEEEDVNDPGRDFFIRSYDEADEIDRQAMREMMMTIRMLSERRKSRVIG